MSFSSRRRNYLLTPHRRDGLIEWMKSMLHHSFVLDALETSAKDTFAHFEMLVEEHRMMEDKQRDSDLGRSMTGSVGQPSRLRQLVPTIGVFHTPLPLQVAFEIYNEKHQLTKRKHIQISFNEIRHILNLAQIIAFKKGRSHEVDKETVHALDSSHAFNIDDGETLSDQAVATDNELPQQLDGPKLVTFDGDQTLYSDGANFESNPRLANYLYQLLRHGVHVAVVTAAGYEYKVEKYEFRLSGLLEYFSKRGLTEEECTRFYLFGGECNYLLRLGSDYRLHPVKESGPGGWCTSTQHLAEAPGNWNEYDVQTLLETAEAEMTTAMEELRLRGRLIRKKRAVGLVPLSQPNQIPRESLDEVVLRVHEKLRQLNQGYGPRLPYCAFNGGNDAWVDVGNKRVGVQVLQSYLGIGPTECLHIGDQFLNTGNDYAARDVSPCIWIINPNETTYILKSILRLAGVSVSLPDEPGSTDDNNSTRPLNSQPEGTAIGTSSSPSTNKTINFEEMQRRAKASQMMDVYSGAFVTKK